MGRHLLRRQRSDSEAFDSQTAHREVKTEASKKSIPLDDVLIEELLAWRQQTPYAEDSDYVFASPKREVSNPTG